MNNMLLRALSGAVYILVIVGCIWGGREWFLVLMAVFTALGMAELQRLLSGRAVMGLPARVCDLIMALCVLLGVYGLNCFNSMSVLLAAMALYVPVRLVLSVADHSPAAGRVTLYSVFSMAYVAWPLALLLTAYCLSGAGLVLATFIFIWINDTGAYLTGRTFGRTKLCERLSPKKTWEGFWGGFILTVVAGIVAGQILGGDTLRHYAIWGAYAAAVSVIGTFGDLFESLIKRTLGVKDSGNMIPGHGGILDRIDSLLAVAPLAALMAFIL